MTRATFLFLLLLCPPLFLIVVVPGHSYSQQVVYPLHVGDRWDYDMVGEATITTDTTFGTGFTYSVFEPAFDGLHHSSFHRQQGSGVYLVDPWTGVDQLWYDFSLTPGDTVNSIPWGSGDTARIILQLFRNTVIFGVERRMWTFLIDPSQYLIDDGWGIDIVDSIGIYSYAKWWGGYELRGAVINGVQYGTITSIEDRQSFPQSFTLHQNYPNPFNAISNFRFKIAKFAHVSLTIYDLLGQEIATIVNERLSPGSYTRQWDATGHPSGVYFYRMQAGNFVDARKLLLLK